MNYYIIEHLPLYKMDENGNIYHRKKGNKLKTFVNKSGYLLCYPYLNRKKLTILHHRLVATVFFCNPENKKYVNHKDGDKTNNHPSNLEWCTPLENSLHSINVLGNKMKGGDRPKLNKDKAKEIRFKNNNGFNISQLSREYNVTRTTIKKIIDNKSYKTKKS